MKFGTDYVHLYASKCEWVNDESVNDEMLLFYYRLAPGID